MNVPKLPALPNVPPPPLPLGMPQGGKPSKRPMTPSVLGAQYAPEPGEKGTATLLGN